MLNDQERNKQKFIPKNLSFAIIQSENAMSVGNISAKNKNTVQNNLNWQYEQQQA